MHWRKNFAATDKAIGAHSLEKDGKYVPVVVTIERFYNDKITGPMGSEQKRFVKLKEFRLPMIVNLSNYKRLEKFFNSFDESDYLGKQITLGVEDVSVARDKVKALRFSTRPINVVKPKTPVKDEDLPKVKELISSGATTLEKIMETRSLTQKQIDEIKSK